MNLVAIAESVIPEIKHQDEVRVKIASSGLCGSDLPRIFKNGAHYYPITLGHEFSGYIDAVGSGVDDLHPGDAVACVPLLPCFTCPECLKGFYSQCAKYDFIGSRRDGGFAEYIVVKRKNVFALPTDMPIEDGAFIEPITVGLHAFHLAQGCENKNVIIIGAGTIGLLAIQCAVALGAKSVTAIDISSEMAIQCAVALGAKSVTAIDISSEKLALAKSFGAMQTFNSSEMSAPQMQSVLRELRFNQLILETAGVPQTVELAVEIAGPHAQLALVGTLHQDLHLTSATFGKILRKELTVIGSWMNYSSPWPGQEWETASRLLTERKLSLEPLIAHRGSFESFELTVIGSWMNYSSPWPGQEWETASRLLTERKLSLEPLIAHRGSFESFTQAVRDIARNAMPGKVLLIP